MKIENNTLKETVTSVSEDVKEKICDQYCKWPEMYSGKDEDKLYEERCDSCPLNRL